MKNIVSFLVLGLILVSCKSESGTELTPETYQINGTAKGVFNGIRAYIVETGPRGRQIKIDTAIVMNEAFSFTGIAKKPALKSISINGIKSVLPIVLEPGILTLEINKENIRSSKVTGSKNNTLLKTYLSNYSQKPEYTFNFIDQHANSDFALFLLESLIQSKNKNIERINKSYTLLNKIIKKTPENQLIGDKIKQYLNANASKANLSIGKTAPNFSAPTPDGKPLALSDIKGKVTLIDFWASWCRPCRVENPNVVKIYEKYHKKGLEIISVSLDKKSQKNRWLKAIEDDNLQWHHVSNLEFWNEPVAKMYSVSSIPATFLLDADGKIIAKKLRGKALENKIAELLD
ncbi:MAG: AhpC/TSA family protein [Flavobacteriaceae bacterium]|nr:AhpC/TSA family protein [Flavobacteriaceae bacterium]